ncbi:hypothetical protein JCM6882_008861 [Rhodosporidiobolus microsporus]
MVQPNAAAANVLGVLGAVFWSIQLIPQIIVNYRRHHAKGLQSSMMLLWAAAGVPLGAYNIASELNIALRVQPQILAFLSLLTFTQVKYYKKARGARYPPHTTPSLTSSFLQHWSIKHCALVLSIACAIMGGIQAGLIFALYAAEDAHLEWPYILMAVLAAVLLCLGVGRHYVDVWQHHEVRGVSLLFVGIDAAGDLTSLLSVFFEEEVDYVATAAYAAELALWTGILSLAAYYHFRPSKRSIAAAAREAEQARAEEQRVGSRGEVPVEGEEIVMEPLSRTATSHSSAVSVFQRRVVDAR